MALNQDYEVKMMAASHPGLSMRLRRAKEKIVELGSISEETAKTHQKLGIEEWILEKLVQRHMAKRTDDGRYYVPQDKPSEIKWWE